MKRSPLSRGLPLRRSRPIRRKRARARVVEWTEEAGKEALAKRSKCCERCGKGGPLDWHHRKNKSQGGTWAPSNGLLLCRYPCHDQVTNTRPEYYDAGWCVKEWQDPVDVPFEHWQWGKVKISDDSTDYVREAA